MAIFHFSAKIVGRSSGRSSVAAAAYRAGQSLKDERIGLTFNYEKKKHVEAGEILAPDGVRESLLDRATLWNAVEQIETRKDAQLAREIEFSLPMELSEKHQKRMAKQFVQRQFVDRGMIADMAFHNLGRANPHCHVMLTTRTVGPTGFGGKERAWNAPALLVQWREAWAKHANLELERAKKDARIDHRTLAAQHADAVAKGDRLGAILLDRPPQIHVGHKQSAERQEVNQTIQETALLTVTLSALREQKEAEGVAETQWKKMTDWQASHERRASRVENWRRVHPRVIAFFGAFGGLPKALKKLIDERDRAAKAVTAFASATEKADLAKTRARDLANLLEQRAAERKQTPSPAPQNPAPVPSAPATSPKPQETPEEARKRGWKR